MLNLQLLIITVYFLLLVLRPVYHFRPPILEAGGTGCLSVDQDESHTLSSFIPPCQRQGYLLLFRGLALVPDIDYRACNKYRRIRTHYDPQHEGQGKIMYDHTSEEIQRQNNDKGGH